MINFFNYNFILKCALYSLLISLFCAFRPLPKLQILSKDSDLGVECKYAGTWEKASFPAVQGHIKFSPMDLQNSELRIVALTHKLKSSSIPLKKNLAKKHNLATKKYPAIIFTSNKITGTQTHYKAYGKLKIKDKTFNVCLPFSVETYENYFIIDAQIRLPQSKFNISINKEENLPFRLHFRCKTEAFK
jgi:polyisoprenoid-binding protein YceI